MRELQTPRLEALLLTEFLPGIHGGIGSAVPQVFNVTSTIHIIVISGFKLLPILVVGIPILETYSWRNAQDEWRTVGFHPDLGITEIDTLASELSPSRSVTI